MQSHDFRDDPSFLRFTYEQVNLRNVKSLDLYEMKSRGSTLTLAFHTNEHWTLARKTNSQEFEKNLGWTLF